MPQIDGAPITLHFAPRTRSLTALWLLEELGVDYRIERVDLSSGVQRGDAFRTQLNPMGKVPVVVDHGVPVAELGAIALYLADKYGMGTLAPALDDPRRAAYLRWVLFSPAVMEPCLGEKFFKWEIPSAQVAWGSFERMLGALVPAIEPGPFLLGDTFTAADVLVGSTARFGVAFGAMEKDGPVADYVKRCSERPAMVRARAIEKEMLEPAPGA